jgi:F0F1-type ATP synthase assembly protein I
MKKGSQRETPDGGALAFTLVALVLIFTGAGYLVDRWLHTGPWVMVAGVFVGFGLGLTYVAFIPFGGFSGRSRRTKGADEDDPGKGGG